MMIHIYQRCKRTVYERKKNSLSRETSKEFSEDFGKEKAIKRQEDKEKG